METSWIKLKQKLIKSGSLSDVFKSLEAVAWDKIDDQEYEPLLITENVKRVSELVEECLEIRREIRELEILAVKSAVDYDLFVITSAIDEEMETLRLFREAKEKEKQGYEKAIEQFGTGSTTDRGWGAISYGRAASLAEDIKSSQQLALRIAKRWGEVKQYHAEYAQRCKEKGNAHNFGERWTNLLKIFMKEIKEAVGRTTALRSGLKSIYDWDTDPLPSGINLSPSAALAALDEFALWVLDVRRGLSFRNERETLFDIVVPLVQPWLKDGNGLMKKADFDSAILGQQKPPILRFEITKSVFFDEEKVRLKGLGLAFGNKFQLGADSGIDKIQTGDSFTRLAVKINTPLQKSAEGRQYSRPVVIFGNVCLHHAESAMAFTEGVSVNNISPFGSWEIHLHPWLVWKDERSVNLKDKTEYNEPIRDLKLVFRAYIPARR